MTFAAYTETVSYTASGLNTLWVVLAVVVVLLVVTALQHRRHAAMTDARLCRACGESHPSHARFCRRCGSGIAQQ